ncbi:hypothetical protein BSKO_05234 [Bryopsis sp. KO-2023]|nr:hypothetical protein BSKO_05234 [Bryopsis sp. KO-2023]
MSSDQAKGLFLAISSSIFIGSSFIIKKKGLKIAGASGKRAGSGGYSYLKEPIWWAGMVTMVGGEFLNFAAYAFAPAVLVTPLGALSIVVSAILSDILLKEKLNLFGVTGIIQCVAGAVVIVSHVPEERQLQSVSEAWMLAFQPGFVLYTVLSISATLYLIFFVAPSRGTTDIFVYVAICSIVGSLSVMSCKALGIAIKLTFEGHNQLMNPQTYACAGVVAVCVVIQMNYLNKSLDLFNTAIVSPLYYVMFTTFTVVASMVMFQDPQTTQQIVSEACGFLTIVCGTFVLHATRDMDISWSNLSSLVKSRRKDDAEIELPKTSFSALQRSDEPYD